jgi:hypothetical protein
MFLEDFVQFVSIKSDGLNLFFLSAGFFIL